VAVEQARPSGLSPPPRELGRLALSARLPPVVHRPGQGTLHLWLQRRQLQQETISPEQTPTLADVSLRIGAPAGRRPPAVVVVVTAAARPARVRCRRDGAAAARAGPATLRVRPAGKSELSRGRSICDCPWALVRRIGKGVASFLRARADSGLRGASRSQRFEAEVRRPSSGLPSSPSFPPRQDGVEWAWLPTPIGVTAGLGLSRRERQHAS
jgi:hypothetical protein